VLLAQLSRHRGGGLCAVPYCAPLCPPLAPVLFRVPILFDVLSCRAAFAFSGSSPLHLLCCLRAAHTLAAAPQRALRPLLWDRDRPHHHHRTAHCASGLRVKG